MNTTDKLAEALRKLHLAVLGWPQPGEPSVSDAQEAARAALAAYEAEAKPAEPVAYIDREALLWLANKARTSKAYVNTYLYKTAPDDGWVGVHLAAPAAPAPVEPGSMRSRPERFTASEDGRTIDDDDFEHDATLTVSGDFGSDSERKAYSDRLCALLNAAPAAPADNYDSIWNAMQAIDTAACAHPLFVVEKDGGIDAVAHNIVSLIHRTAAPAAPAPSDTKDAERYRWLRDKGGRTWLPFTKQWQLVAEHCDAAIDAAIAASKGGAA